MNHQFDFRDRPLVEEMKAAEKLRNKHHVSKLLLEWRIWKYHQQQQTEVNKAMVQV